MTFPTRILLIDDNPADRALATRELSQTLGNFIAIEVSTAEQFEDALRCQDFDLVITDYQLRWNNGLAVFDAIRAKNPDCPVIMFTGSGDEEIAVEGLQRGLDDYVPKHARRYANLAASVLRTLQRHGERKALRAMEEERVRVTEALRLNEKLAELGRMAGVIAHEINNPLESVTNLLYLLRNSGRLDDQLMTYAGMAETELARISHIAKQTLSFYRESNTPTRTDLSELLDGLLSMFVQKIDNHIIVRRRFSQVKPVLTYTSQIRQVFSNLMANAIEAMGKTGGTLSIRLRESRKWSQPSIEGVRVTVADTGQGITPENRQRLFEAFFTTKGDKGTGLGLWVSYGILGRHGGTIDLRSSTDPRCHGTVFSVFLPHHPEFQR